MHARLCTVYLHIDIFPISEIYILSFFLMDGAHGSWDISDYKNDLLPTSLLQPLVMFLTWVVAEYVFPLTAMLETAPNKDI